VAGGNSLATEERLGWEIYPQGFENGLVDLKKFYIKFTCCQRAKIKALSG